MPQGLFISFEGGEGSGKTTQINRLAETLTAQGHKIITTREPGGVPEAEKIRNLLVQRDGGNWTADAEMLLFCAARVMHLEKLIKPALAEGKIVITDRFSDSTMAYQCYGHGADKDKLQMLDEQFIGGAKPDLTFILDIPATVGLSRATGRMIEDDTTEDRFEKLDIAFHERLRQGFLEIAKQEPERCHVIDATKSVDEIASKIADIAAGALK